MGVRKQYYSPIIEWKLNDGIMNLDFSHSVRDPIVEQQCPGEILSNPRIPRSVNIAKLFIMFVFSGLTQ